METTTKLQTENAKLLAKRSTIPAKKCGEQISKIDARLKEIDARVAEIDVNIGYDEPGPERKIILETGSPQELLELNTELDLVEAERQSLHAQYEALLKCKTSAEISEAPGRAKVALKKLCAVLKAAEKTRSAHEQNLAQLEVHRAELAAARTTADEGDVKPHALGPGEFSRLCQLMGWSGNQNIARLQRMHLTDWTPTPELPEGRGEKRRRLAKLEAEQRREQSEGAYLNQSNVPAVKGG